MVHKRQTIREEEELLQMWLLRLTRQQTLELTHPPAVEDLRAHAGGKEATDSHACTFILF